MDFFWTIFEKSGSIEAYLGYKEFEYGRNNYNNENYNNVFDTEVASDF